MSKRTHASFQDGDGVKSQGQISAISDKPPEA